MSHNVLGKNLLTIGKLVFSTTCFLAAGSAFAGSAAANIAAVDPWLSVNGSGDLIPQAGGVNDGANDFSFGGTATAADQYTVDWGLVVNPDPFVNGSFTITNLSASAQNFTVTLNLPVTPAFSPGVMGGSIDATVYDQNNSGSATLQPQGANIYFGTIDGGDALLMFAQTANCTGVGCSVNSGESQTSIGVAGVNTKIGTRLVFNLSAGDKVSFVTHFEVTPVPLPATAWMLGSALLGLIGVRRRR